MNTRNLIESELKSFADSSLNVPETETFTGVKGLNALSSVINYIITDAFDLNPTESIWVGHQLRTNVLDSLEKEQPELLLAAVEREIHFNEYSQRLISRTVEYSPENSNYSPEIKYAKLSDWVESMSDIILFAYPNLRPIIHSKVVGSVHGLLSELGLSDDCKKSRPSLYLPNAVRYTSAR